MKYKGIYWTLFAPMMKKSITRRFDKDLAEKAIRQGKKEYQRLLAKADDLGPGNPMATNAYFAYVFAGAWLGSGKKISPDQMALVMTDVLESRLLRTVFGMTDLNKAPKKWEQDMRKYEAWFNAHGHDYPVNWNVSFDESRHSTGSFYYFTRCPICEFCNREGISELMPALCSTDEVMFRLQHGKLHREHTIAGGDAICDYWIVGDRTKEAEPSHDNGSITGAGT
ncbi:MAG: L-2-amino-thiazoline-4-carboxylic acid hydrolase [Clostridia bacterium]|nr:L-2-amino-thiazoline-4-carboxylic acid hydrolase [Clostridia bacterium]